MIVGVTYEPNSKLWRVRPTLGKKRVYIGDYKTEVEALAALHEFTTLHHATKPDYNRLARNPVAWDLKAKEIIKNISCQYETAIQAPDYDASI